MIKKVVSLGKLFILVGFICSSTVTLKAVDKKGPVLSLTASTAKPTNKSLKITLKASDVSGISQVKWSEGSKSISYFAKSGNKLTLNTKKSTSVVIKTNGIYSFYVKDKAGNVTIKKSTIKNIDKKFPSIQISSNNTKPTNKNIKLNISVSDKESGIKTVRYLVGKKTAKNFINAGKVLKTSSVGRASLAITKNQEITFLTEDLAGNQLLKIFTVKNIDKSTPKLSAEYKVMNQKAKIKVATSDKETGIKSICYLKGKVTNVNSTYWATKGKLLKDRNYIDVSKDGYYSILAEDLAGNKTIRNVNIVLEMRAVWISYLEFDKAGYTETSFRKHIKKMFDNCLGWNLNTVIVQVRPSGDALYKSTYFPWSNYVSGSQGKNPGYDPLKIMVEEAHSRNLMIHAWINPYRVSISGSDIRSLSKDNPARKWRESTSASKKRNVLTFDGKLYYNPAKKEVQDLIINGIKEIVKNYNIDGIHFDDYFYPSLDASKYTTTFDNLEYNDYVELCKEKNDTPKSIVAWRRSNINNLVKRTYASIKNLKTSVEFGISPAGNIDNLLAKNKYYVDIGTWLSSSSYVDYICPQIYWSFQNKICPFATTVERWLKLRTSNTVNMYIGIPLYKGGSKEDEFAKSQDVIKRQVEYGRQTKRVDGYFYYRYTHFENKTTAKEVNNLLSVLK